jgi:GNAT superfamily N-acetyltransferase
MDKLIYDLIDQNYVMAFGWLTSHTVVGEFYNTYKISIFNTGVPNRQFNIAFVKDKTSQPDKLAHKWELFFQARQLPYRVSFRPGLEKLFTPLLSEKGYQENPPEPVMTLMDLPDTVPLNPHLKIQPVSNPEVLAHFQKVIEKSYQLPAGSGPYVITEKVLGLPGAEMFLGYADGQPACASMMIKTGPVAGIYWVATVDEFRGRGFGKSITLQAAAAGKISGCKFACLQASAMGRPLYESLGFDTPYCYVNFASP